MGTKVEYAINLLSANISSSKSFSSCVDDRGIKGRIHQRKDFMDTNMLQKHNLDSIKRTMQMQEDTFKHQVRELHRLYNVQKKLMGELKKEMEKNRFWTTPMATQDDHLTINPRQHYHQTTQSACGQAQMLRDDPIRSRERSGSYSGDNMRTRRGFDLERPADQEDMSTGVSANEDQAAGPSSRVIPPNKCVDGSDDESGVELTLSIGGSSSGKKRSSKDYNSQLIHSRELHSSASFKAERGGDCSDPTTPMSSSSASIDQERKRPHWLFQGLSLNSGS